MSQGCCDNEKPSVLSRVRQSMLCGVYGSLIFSVSAMSYVQASIFMKACGKYYLPKRAYDLHMRDRAAAKRNMMLGIIPAIEMFIIMPAMFYALHCVLNVPWIYCLIACWVTMFAICMAVRLAGIVKNCPDFRKPIYSRGHPFAMMKDESGNLHDGDNDFERSTEPAMHIPKLTAYLLGFAFLGFRLLSAIAYVLLCCLELICIPFTFTVEFFKKLSSLVKGGSVSAGYIRESYDAGLIGLSERLERASVLIRAAGHDLLWVLTFGISGATRLKDATLFWDSGWEDLEPEVQHYREMSEHKDGKDGRGGGSCCHKRAKKEGAASEATGVSPSQHTGEEGNLQKMSKLGLSHSLGARWFNPDDASPSVWEDVVVSQSMGPRCHSSGAY
ncbi:hypothetical protein [Anaplasma phagocytophilum]|uniref:Uncharacterized protein n=1 Tax=Anaplasma phagocytophilum (strain HZ) TaxID=212042 RepID=Q2GL71_ANAPZ|nr:hypothetical protein [Anaplasma phagocytophilum]ABD44205.1 hypothetical protein APH_0265 [Anaplasma phagocytophilum str. HZ]AGR79253.1 hypothetical protein YYU_01260 [Anaplasma phagocytophilum str. HZ2]